MHYFTKWITVLTYEQPNDHTPFCQMNQICCRISNVKRKKRTRKNIHRAKYDTFDMRNEKSMTFIKGNLRCARSSQTSPKWHEGINDNR